MIYGSVCSGIEGATVAWHPLGWRSAWYAEIDPFCSALLKHHYPGTPNYGDFIQIREGTIDLLVGGTPCQSFSVAGKRAGLDDPRGNLTLEFLALAGRLRPRWVVWENVPGVLSIDHGRTFGTFLRLLGELGYGFAYRILDAQHFGVPQRRRRVFVVGYLGDWRRAAAVLFERTSLSGNPPPSRETGQDVALPVTSRVDRGGEHREARGNNLIASTLDASYGEKWGLDDQHINSGAGLFVMSSGQGNAAIDARTVSSLSTIHDPPIIANPLPGHHPRADLDNDTYIAFDYKQSGETDPTMRALGHDKSHANGGGHLAVAIPILEVGKRENVQVGRESAGIGNAGDPMFTLQSGAQHGVASSGVRRLTPRECERLQGFPDDYTAIPYRGKPAADGPRYRALGNSFAVPVVRWIGQRIQMVEEISETT